MKRFFSVLVALTLLIAPLSAQQVQFPYVSTDATPLRALIEGLSTTTATLFVAGGTGIRNYITQITCVNNSSTALSLDILDGLTSTGLVNAGPTGTVTNGTRAARIGCPASSVNSTVTFTPPLKLSANTATTIMLLTTNAGTQTVHVTATGFKAR